MHHVFETMGTVASLELPHPDSAAIDRVEAAFAEADQRYSLYRADSELSLINSGAASLIDSSEELRELYSQALRWGDRTHGAFTANRPDGAIDLNGIVKAWAMDEAAQLLRASGSADWSLNVGGDVVCSGTSHDGQPWTIGIVDPADRTRLLLSLRLSGSRTAVATSGSAERGDHIWRGGSTAAVEYSQVTVVADDIVTADVLATAVVAGGREILDLVTREWAVDVVTVDRTGVLTATPGIRSALAS